MLTKFHLFKKYIKLQFVEFLDEKPDLTWHQGWEFESLSFEELNEVILFKCIYSNEYK